MLVQERPGPSFACGQTPHGITDTTLNGEVWPAVCDLNGDGVGELVLGLGQGSNGTVQVLEAAESFMPAWGTPLAEGWLQVDREDYRNAGHGTYPACGDLDEDGKDELVLGLTGFPPDGGWVEIKDDLMSNLSHRSWARLYRPDDNSANGLTRPAVAQ